MVNASYLESLIILPGKFGVRCPPWTKNAAFFARISQDVLQDLSRQCIIQKDIFQESCKKFIFPERFLQELLFL